MKKEEIKKLTELGREWEKDFDGKKFHRIYFEDDFLFRLIKLECVFHKTGNVKQAKLNGEKISNGLANGYISQIRNGRFHFDVIAEQFNGNLPPELFNEIEEKFKIYIAENQ